jgi:hypothetical protein
MTFDNIEQAIGLRLAGLGKPVAWPNRDFTPNGTYIEFRHSPGARFDETIDATGPRQTGIVLLTVVTRAGGFATEANNLAQTIADLFPKALRIPAGSGKVLISAPSSLGPPFQDGAYWRQPVRVFYLTES